MTVQIALCDDETSELNKTEKILDAYGQKHTDADFIIDRFKRADELLCMVKEGKYSPQLIFMDVYMPGEEAGDSAPLGIEAARRLRDMGNEAKLVFLAASKEHALDAFEVGAFQYMLKPIQPDKLFSTLDRFRIKTEGERAKYILLRVERTLRKVSLNDIIFCEAHGKYQYIYLADGTEIQQNLTMTRICEMFSTCRELVKVGVSYIVHLKHIVSLNTQEMLLDNGRKIYLPRGTYRLLREQYHDYCGRKK